MTSLIWLRPKGAFQLMPMGGTGKGKTLVSVSIADAWRNEIDQRATALRMSRAAYVRMII
jgi:hypothetical protein